MERPQPMLKLLLNIASLWPPIGIFKRNTPLESLLRHLPSYASALGSRSSHGPIKTFTRCLRTDRNERPIFIGHFSSSSFFVATAVPVFLFSRRSTPP